MSTLKKLRIVLALSNVALAAAVAASSFACFAGRGEDAVWALDFQSYAIPKRVPRAQSVYQVVGRELDRPAPESPKEPCPPPPPAKLPFRVVAVARQEDPLRSSAFLEVEGEGQVELGPGERVLGFELISLEPGAEGRLSARFLGESSGPRTFEVGSDP
jgi:hypothetical protein